MSISRASTADIFSSFSTALQRWLPSAALAPHSFLPTEEGCSGSGVARVDRLSHEIRIAIKFRG